MSGLGDDIRATMAEKYERQIEQRGINCPTEGCDGTHIDAEVWVADTGGFDAAALCRDCNTRVPINLMDNGAREAANEIEESLADFQDALDEFDG